jgi:murein DD-endopeptidase MepM/ murein hydrolase activator NlpD
VQHAVKSAGVRADSLLVVFPPTPFAWRRAAVAVVSAACLGLGLGSMAAAQTAGAPSISRLDAPGEALQPAARMSLRLPPSPERRLIFPVDADRDCYILDNFGENRGGRLHEGLDIMGSSGRAVFAVADGTLTRRYTNTGTAGWGWTLHDPVTRTWYRYFHLTEDPAGRQLGDRVTRGDVIGYVGSSGTNSPTNIHLHFEVRPNDRPVDPLPLVQMHPNCRVSPPIR